MCRNACVLKDNEENNTFAVFENNLIILHVKKQVDNFFLFTTKLVHCNSQTFVSINIYNLSYYSQTWGNELQIATDRLQQTLF